MESCENARSASGEVHEKLSLTSAASFAGGFSPLNSTR